METLEKDMKYVQSYFTPFSSVFNVHFEQVNVGWVITPNFRSWHSQIILGEFK